jgi:hypothetical protein
MSVFSDLQEDARLSAEQDPTGDGLADVLRAVRVLAGQSRQVVSDAGEVLDREVDMAISIAERLRDETLSPEILTEARTGRLTSAIRGNAHRIIDLMADTGGAATVVAVRFVERITDEPREPLTSRPSAANAQTVSGAEEVAASG